MEHSGWEQVEWYIWDGDQIALTLDENGNVIHRYLYGPLTDQILADERWAADERTVGDDSGSTLSYDETLWVLADYQGSVVDLVDHQGNLQNTIVYDSFGTILRQTDESLEFAFGYTGRDYDQETGLNYHRSRYYDPQIGRWLSQCFEAVSGVTAQ